MIALQTLWFLLPAALANMAPIIAVWLIPKWNTPIDFGRKMQGIEIFGAHKTYRGLASGIGAGLLTFFLQRHLYETFAFAQELSLFNYAHTPVLFGAWMGACALGGDLLKSFFKRRRHVPPGEPWIPFDQIDWIIGGLAGALVVYQPSLALVALSFLMGVSLHFLIKAASYWSNLSPTPL